MSTAMSARLESGSMSRGFRFEDERFCQWEPNGESVSVEGFVDAYKGIFGQDHQGNWASVEMTSPLK
jgi:hypothetical protein